MDQFPNSVEENALVMYEILKGGGFKTGGLNFDAKIRRQSIDKYDIFYGHIGAMDSMALSLKCAAKMLEDKTLNQIVLDRYSNWDKKLGKSIMQNQMSLQQIAEYSLKHDLQHKAHSGQQEKLENIVNKFIFG